MASPFSLHCVICIEEFTEDDRYPVVLPCGHTYICNQCAERLTKCTECRTPLTISAPRPPQIASSPSVPSYRSRVRGVQHRYENPSAKTPSPPKRLPLPKNVVLMSLIDSSNALASVNQTTNSDPDEHNQPFTERESEDSDEEARIRLGTSLATSASGTYIVRAATGVHIFPSKPLEIEGERSKGGNESQENEDVDAMVRFFHLDHKLVVSSPGSPENDLPPGDLSKGDRVQIVSIDDGWAKLARGYGFVRCSNGEIVKVGGPVDRACKLEALLRTISLRRKELRMEQQKIDSQFLTFMKDLQTSLLNDEDLTVIGAEAYAEVDKETSSPLKEVESNNSSIDPSDDRKQAPRSPDIAHTNVATIFRGTGENNSVTSSPTPFDNRQQPPSSPSHYDTDTDLSKPHRMVRSDTPRDALSNSLSCFMGALSFSDDNSLDDAGPPAILGSCSGDGWGGGETRTRRNEALYSSFNQQSPRTSLRNSQIFRSSSRTDAGVDFRTGMSGHSGMLSTNKHSSKPFLKSPGRMSAHMGLNLPSRGTMHSVSKSFDNDDDSLTI
mmetsp:Transcript_5069/g.7345  ORF Transcript_5069/g.7345 Transcript_5069/m.7345 type:complete len:554 (+) Transcript_5069:193-1854(+)